MEVLRSVYNWIISPSFKIGTTLPSFKRELFLDPTFKQTKTMLTVLLIFIQILSCVGIIQINNLVTDNTYLLKPLKVTASPNTVVGVISASGDGSGIINYFITDVFYNPPGSQSYDSGTGGTSSWLLYALSSYDDCSINVLNNYSTRRKCFCIDHITGEIKTTTYFNQIDQNVGGQYKMTLQISQGVVTSKNLLPIVIKLYSVCDSIPSLYKLITPPCDSYSYKTDLITSNQYVSLNFPSTLYVSAIQYSLKAGNSIDKGTNISVKILQSLLVRNLYFYYLNATQIVPLDPPLKLKTNDTFLLQTIIKSSIDIKTFDIRFIAIQEMDFCTSNAGCINATNEYFQYQSNFSQECPSIDQYGFIAKYGYCNDNKAPIVKNQSAFLDFDLMETNHAPISIISNFVYDPEMKFLRYSIFNVKPKYGLLPVSGNTVSNNMNCDSINMQYSLFCFNSSSNTLFTTNSLLGIASPDEVFNISIQVSDLELFPPRLVFFDMVVSCKSLCTKLTSIYRNIYQFCNKEIYSATISNSIISISNTYQIDAVYYITSIKILININCDYMEFLISVFQYNNTATARYFCVGSYALLDRPFIFRNGQLYSITAKVFKQNVLQSIIANFSSLSFLLIKRNDYCTNSLNCINYVNMYNQSFYENPDIKSTCAEVDVYGMIAKYGYCGDNVGPTQTQTNFYIDLNDDYIFTEVIPGNYSMYIYNKNPVEFSINAIEAFRVLSNDVVFPSNCSMTLGDFCINSTTGKIYTSSGIFGKLYSNTSILFYVSVVDISVYPMRSLNVPLQLLITDRCYRSTANYQYVVTNCVNYTSITSVRVNETKKFIFLLYPLERIISLEIDSSPILNVFEYVSFNATFYNNSEEIYSFTSSKVQVKPTLSIPLNVSYGIVTEIHVTIFGHKFDQINIFSQISEPKLKYLIRYICTSNCLTKYSEWLSISQQKPNCNSDLDYLHINFDVCFDPDTMFLSKPTLGSNIVTLEGNVLINSMIYLSPFEFVKSYWLKDGITVLQPLANDQQNLQITQGSLKDNYLLHGFTAGGLLIKNIGISNQGFYQCVIENNGKRFYSEKVKVILSDIACAKANISISGTIWKDQYSNTSNELLKKFLNQLQNGFSSAFFTKGLKYQEVQFYNRNNYVGALVNIFYQIQGGDRIENCRQISKVKFGTNFPVNFIKPCEKVWSTEGCNTTSNSSSIILCQCNHLTNFALILDVDQSGNNPLSLQIITWIGCGISIAGLFITIISYSTFRKLRMNLAPKILINLCVSLMVTLIIFLALVEQTKPRVLCQAVASILQFFILSTFFWMAVEGINLYRMFVKVFRGSYSSRIFMLKSSAFAWGIPLIFTIATAAIKPDYLGPAAKSDPQICVVRGVPFYFGVLLPVCVVIMGNFFILILVLRGVTAKAKLSNNTKVKTQKGYSKIRIALACSVLLGTTWIFAILAVGNLRDAFQWLFCIFNSLQGFFIFVFYTAQNSDVKHQWLKFFGVKKAFRDPSSSSASRTMEKTQKIHLASTINRSSTEKINEKVSSVEKS
ncbi:uncharacterized protein LOC105845287 isoform X4 [Hydra vulgaris]|uniref:Uncharacterized protein LOC105845287 isoform X4 n=1 Tax=Hydra vulgaris TaxID=6087 RepID=A0ABM4CQX4_HYDVU